MFSSFQTVVLLPLILIGLSVSAPLATPGPDDILAEIALQNVYKVLNGTISDGSTRTGCTKEKLAVRKE
jgi:tyrosinase